MPTYLFWRFHEQGGAMLFKEIPASESPQDRDARDMAVMSSFHIHFAVTYIHTSFALDTKCSDSLLHSIRSRLFPDMLALTSTKSEKK